MGSRSRDRGGGGGAGGPVAELSLPRFAILTAVQKGSLLKPLQTQWSKFVLHMGDQ